MDIKFNCSNRACQQRISVDESKAGQPIDCPVCGTLLRVPGSTSIKFNCSSSDCGQHIVVDVSEAGRFVRCPSCGKATQVPGDPPKPFVQPVEKKSLIHSDDALPKSEKKKTFSDLSSLKRLLYGWGCGLGLFICFILGSSFRTWAVLPRKMDVISHEIYMNGDIRDAPIGNHSDTLVFYAQDGKSGLGIFLIGLDNLQRIQIGTVKGTGHGEERAFTAFGWSPDDAWLAYFSQPDSRHEEVVLCYGSTGARKESFDTRNTCGSIDKGIWLANDTLVLLSHSHDLYLLNLQDNPALGKFGIKGFIKLRSLSYYDASWVVPTSNRSIAYFDQGNLWNLNITNGTPVQLTHLPQGILEWLDYSETSGKYLFSFRRLTQVADRLKKGRRLLYEFDPGEAKPFPVAEVQAANGRWIKDDDGIAYVTSIGSTNYLTIQSGDPHLQTNLFQNAGYVRSYSISPDRNKFYAVAANGYKLMSIWEFDLQTKILRNILPMEESYVQRKAVQPIPTSVTNKDGEKVDYYIVPPAQLQPHKKYPVVLDQFAVSRYDQNVQFLSNAGIYYVSTHPVGVNPYNYTATSPEDTMAVYDALLKIPNVDPRRIYISGHSASTYEASELVNEHPTLWRGVILETPVAVPEIPLKVKTFPSIFISIGDHDDPQWRKQAEQFFQEACYRHISARFNYQHSAHTYHSSQYSGEYKSLVKFILTDY